MSDAQSLTIPGRYDQIVRLCHFVAAGAARVGMDEDGVFYVGLACDEACSNIIEHGYGGEDRGEITAAWRVTDNDFVVTIHDHGPPFNPDDIAAPVASSEPDKLKVGGLGLHFMRKIMDTVHFTYDKKQGNVLVMVKRLPGGKGG